MACRFSKGVDKGIGFRLSEGRNSASFHTRVVVAILWRVWGFGVGFGVQLYVCEVGADDVVIVPVWFPCSLCRWRRVGGVCLRSASVGLVGSGGIGDDCYHRLVRMVNVGGATEDLLLSRPDLSLPRIKPWESRAMTAVTVQGEWHLAPKPLWPG